MRCKDTGEEHKSERVAGRIMPGAEAWEHGRTMRRHESQVKYDR